MQPLINESDFTIYALSTELEGKKFAMIATWVMTASLRTDELRFTIALSKFNDSTAAILKTKKFNIQTIDQKVPEVVYTLGSTHSLSYDKFAEPIWDYSTEHLPLLKVSMQASEAEVLSYLETDDRFIAYCRVTKNLRQFDGETLKQKDIFVLLPEKMKNELGLKYSNDCKRDTP